jgi:hypothetical protein
MCYLFFSLFVLNLLSISLTSQHILRVHAQRHFGYVWQEARPMTQNQKNKSYTFSLKTNSNILSFYIKSITFYYYSNKKITKQFFFFTFLYKTFLLVFFFFFFYINQISYSISLLYFSSPFSNTSQTHP